MRITFFGLLLLSSALAQAQGILDLRIDTVDEAENLSSTLSKINDGSKWRIFYLAQWTDPILTEQGDSAKTLHQLLQSKFKGTDLDFVLMDSSTLVIVRDPTQAIRHQQAIREALKSQKKVTQYRFGERSSVNQEAVIIQGRVTDLKSEEPIPYATVQISSTQSGTTTNESGYYQLSVPPGANVLTFNFVEYESDVIDLIAYEDAVINVEMEKKSLMLDEVIIEDKSAQVLSTNRIGQTQMAIPDMKKAPGFLGEPDLIKSVQSLPGVTSVGEAASGFNVRGGGVDQNLILFDGIPVFNSSHVFGFFSAFNPDGIREVSFYRGGIPAEFGGRASSVLDIKSKDGDLEKWDLKGGIGVITSNIALSGPLKRNKTSIAASFRSTYSDWLVHSIRTDYADLRNSTVQFYDGTLKVAHKLGDDTKLTFTGYSSKDGFRLVGDTTYQWHNLQFSGKLNHQFNSQLGGEFVAGVSAYGYEVSNDDELTASELSFDITTTTLKAGFNLDRGKHLTNFGWHLIHYQFNPGELQPKSEVSNVKFIQMDRQTSIENAFYISDSWPVNDRISAEVGVRLPLFISFGPEEVFKYQAGQPMEVSSITDTTSYGTFRPVKTYVGLEPRASFRYMIDETSSLKFGYNRIYQYLHLVTNSTAVTPVDIWQPSGYYFKPQRSDQVSLGYSKDLKSKKYSFSVETFYKYINNILDFKDGAELVLNNHLETDLLQGKAYSYGSEISINKNFGRLSGTVNYTYSRSFRRVQGDFASESINRGKRYPSNFDQPHVANLSWKLTLSRRHSFTGNFTYHTGRPVSIPLSAFTIEQTTVAYFSGRNQYRIPDYHRLDLAFVIEGNYKRSRKWQGTWVFSVYNAYGRRNPYSVFFRPNDEGVPKPYQLSIIGTVFPSISYNLKVF
ncbi:MAG: TonB-dependent receptor [Marinoscillum sp.]